MLLQIIHSGKLTLNLFWQLYKIDENQKNMFHYSMVVIFNFDNWKTASSKMKIARVLRDGKLKKKPKKTPVITLLNV